MTVFPSIAHQLTIDEYAAIGEVEQCRTELQEGSLVLSASPNAVHMLAVAHLFDQVTAPLPRRLAAVPAVDVDLELAPPHEPGTSRRPDLVVVDRAAVQRVDHEGGMLRASEVVLVVEVVSKGSRRMDYHVKRDEYADAGIAAYWIVDLEKPVSLVECHRTEEFGYQDAGAVTGVFTQPFRSRSPSTWTPYSPTRRSVRGCWTRRGGTGLRGRCGRGSRRRRRRSAGRRCSRPAASAGDRSGRSVGR
jgi:Uma2 family endonuclease